MWAAYLETIGENAVTTTRELSAWHFGDNEKDANELADLARRGIKRATSPSLWYFESTNQPLPEAGDLHVVTDWAGEAQCVIRTTAVHIVPFNRITAEYAAIEGEGDRTLEYWRDVHWAYYHRELAGTVHRPEPHMPIVCEYFETVFPINSTTQGPE